MILMPALLVAQGSPETQPGFLPLTHRGSQRVATMRVGGRAVRLWVLDGLDGEYLFVDRKGGNAPEPRDAVRWDRQTGTTTDGKRIDGYQGTFDVPRGDGQARYMVRLLESNTKDPRFKRVRDRLEVTEVPIPPDLSPGRAAPSLVSRTLSGQPLRFPGAFRGKLVLMDVWATWCGPCRQEIPYLKRAYARFHKRGFEIASFSIDELKMRGRVAAYTKAMGETWPQAIEGQGWKSRVCQRYAIQAVPFMLLVDGTSGRIVAAGDRLFGPEMSPSIDRALRASGR